MVTSCTPSASVVTLPRSGFAEDDAVAVAPLLLPPHPASTPPARTTPTTRAPIRRALPTARPPSSLIGGRRYAWEARPARDRRPSARRRPRRRPPRASPATPQPGRRAAGADA